MAPFPSRTSVKTDVLDVQIKQLKYTLSVENVHKLGNFTLKYVEIERLQVKLSMTAYPERAYYMFISLLTSVHTAVKKKGNTDIQLSFQTSLVEHTITIEAGTLITCICFDFYCRPRLI